MIIGDSLAGPIDRGRQLVNIAINAGRAYQSAQTGFVHICYRPLDEEHADTIPLYENFLFALALLRERTSESVKEGKSLLSKLLNFQSFFEETSQGNFPVYLHEYPSCKDTHLAGKLLPVFYWIVRNFYLVLGAELREQLASAASIMLGYLRELDECQLSFMPTLRLAIAKKAFGELWEQPVLVEEAEETLTRLSQSWNQCPYPISFCPKKMGEVLLLLQLAYQRVEDSPWQSLWEHASQFWHTQTGSYCGPAWDEWQHKREPEVTILDWVLGFHAPNLSYRAFNNGPHLLECALIHPTEDKLEKTPAVLALQGSDCERAWCVQKTESFTWSALEKDQMRPSKDSSLAPFRLLWGDINNTQTFVLQGGHIERVYFEKKDRYIDLFLQLPSDIPPEAGRKNREVQLFLSYNEDTQLCVQGVKAATTFQLGEELSFSSAGLCVSFSIELEEGRGQFFGHIARANRPSQRACTGDSRFVSYDWHFFLRTMQRSSNCLLRLRIQLNEEEKSL